MKRIDYFMVVIPVIIILMMFMLFTFVPDGSRIVLDSIRNFLGNQLSIYYLLMGLGMFIFSLFLAFSNIGKVRLGQRQTPRYRTFTWGAMIFTGTMAADILYFSLVEWAYYFNEPRVQLQGVQEWGLTYSLFHWGPIPWSFYIVLAVAFGFMLHVRNRTRQKFSEACRPILGHRVDGWMGTVIDLTAIVALLAGTATTFSVATPLMTSSLAFVFGFSETIGLTILILALIAVVYILTVLFGYKGISFMSKICVYLFSVLLFFILTFGQNTVFILETGVESIGLLAQNIIALSTTTDPLRLDQFPQNWTLFYWAYWMSWCVATPFFIGVISEGRTIKNTIFGAYGWGLLGTFTSFIVLGGYGMAQQVLGTINAFDSDVLFNVPASFAVSVLSNLPFASVIILLIFVILILFYSTTFDSITVVISTYSHKSLTPGEEPSKKLKIFWAFMFILFPIALIFSESSLTNLQTVSIITAFPIGLIFVMISFGLYIDAKKYQHEQFKEKTDYGKN